MENYVSAELEVVALLKFDLISVSIEIETGDNELPIDRFSSF